MSERMTDERIRDLCEQEPGLDAQDAEVVLSELKRARASEDQKDATIKALADALGGDSGKGHNIHGEGGRESCDECCRFAPNHGDACRTAAALRLAGRL